MTRSHAEKRLDARASPASIERGLALLRDRKALAEWITRLGAASDGVGNSDRVAFALAAGDNAAHVVVAKDGSAVTTLGPGMAFTWPRVPFAVVESYLKGQEQALLAKKALQSVKDADDDVSPVVRYIRHPQRLVRREWEVLRALEPLLGDLFADGIKHAIGDVVAPVALGVPVNDVAAEELWRLYVTGAISFSLLADQTHADGLMLAACASVDVILTARALWCLANRPASTLASIERFAPQLHESALLPAAVAAVLDAVAFRSPGFAKDAQRLSKALLPEVPVDDGDTMLRDVRRATTAFLPALLPRFVPHVAVFHDVDAVARVRACAADDDDACAAAAGGWHQDVWKIWRPLAARHEAPRLVARHQNGITDVDDASITMWRALLRRHNEALLRRPYLARLVTLAPFEALIPAVDVDADWKLSEGAAYLQKELPLIIHDRQLPAEAKKAPATAEKKTPPNAPCPCGSGKKFKKCHGRA